MRSTLTRYQSRALREYERILEVIALNPDRVVDLARDDPTAVIPVLRNMTDQAVRSDVVFEYTYIDMLLDEALRHHVFGRGQKIRDARRTKRFKTFTGMLQSMYLLQKLSLVRTFRQIPKHIVSNVAAINNLRNALAHTFLLGEVKPSKRKYKGHNIATLKGITAFRSDAQEIRDCLMEPWLRRLMHRYMASLTTL